MKSIAEILKSKGITEATRFHNYEYLFEMMKTCCEEYAGQFSKPDVSGNEPVQPKNKKAGEVALLCPHCNSELKIEIRPMTNSEILKRLKQ